MTLPKLLAATAAGLLAVTVAAVGLAQAPPPPPPPARAVPDAERLQGEWLFDSATAESGWDALQGYWNARLTFRQNTVAISGSPYSEAAVETTFTLDPTASPKRMDWAVPEFYRTLLKLPAGSVPGIYKLDPDGSLTVCMANKPGAGPRTATPAEGEKRTAEIVPFGPRPTEFKADAAKGHFLFTVKRWTGKPGEKLTEGKVTVLDPDGKPVEKAQVVGLAQRMPEDDPNTWRARGGAETGADGTARPAVDGAWLRLTAHHAGRKLIAYADASPAGLHHGVTVRLAPRATVSGKLAVDPPPATGGAGWTNVYLKRPGPGGKFLAGYADTAGRFEFIAPPGDYELKCYGDLLGNKTVPLTVPPGVPAVDAGTVTAPPTAWGKVVGRPNPGLPGVVKWVGPPAPLDGLKGKVVLLYFSNVASVEPKPAEREAVVATHQKHAAAGLAVVGVFGDGTGESLNAAAAAIELLKLPFPVAIAGGLADDWGFGLVERARFRAAAAYGVEPYGAFGVLIDRRGVVRGRWYWDAKPDDGLLEKLLAEK